MCNGVFIIYDIINNTMSANKNIVYKNLLKIYTKNVQLSGSVTMVSSNVFM